MARKNINSFNLLSTEDKQYLRRVCRYLASLGMRDGLIEIEIEYGWDFDFSEVNWEEDASHFSNNYSAEVPSGLIPILKKIGDHIQDNGLFKIPGQDDINYERIEIDIDCTKQEVSITHWWSFYSRGDSDSISWDGEEDRQMFEEWEKHGVLDGLEIPNDGVLTLKYNGSGDSGYLENYFDENNDSVPAAIEDWCYRELERNFGGWEINEGSDGQFTFNFHDMTVELSHTYNTEDHEVDTIYEESFAE